MDENPYRAPQAVTPAIAPQASPTWTALKKIGFAVLLVSAAVNSVGLIWLVLQTLL